MYRIEIKDAYLFMVFLLMISASGTDIFWDMSHGASLLHVVQEGILLCLSLVAVYLLLMGIRSQRQQITALKTELVSSRETAQHAQKYLLEARQQFREVIKQQFNDWGLSPSEQEVGLLLLKGLSLKEIAVIRDTMEKTVRQQASAIYKKAGLNGRHAFSAWFIEDIL